MLSFSPAMADWQGRAIWTVLLYGLLIFLGAIWPPGRLSRWVAGLRKVVVLLTGLFFLLVAAFAVAYLGGSLGSWVFAFAALFFFEGLVMVVWATRRGTGSNT